MKKVKLSELFLVKYGVCLSLNKLEQVEILNSSSVYFVSRTSKNNGISAIVKKVDGIEPNPGNTISVAAGGSVLEAFYQREPYYSGFHLFYLKPKLSLTENEILFYCYCIRENKFKYNFGRQANKTLKDILLPDQNEIPGWVNDVDYKKILEISLSNFSNKKTTRARVRKNLLKVSELFHSINGLASSQVTRYESKDSEDFVPYLRPSNSQDSSIDAFINKKEVPPKYLFPPNTLYVSTDGQGSHSYSYVSAFEFVPNSNITVLMPKIEMCLQEKIYYAIAITRNRFKFSYGRKPKGKRLSQLHVPSNTPKFIYDDKLFSKVIADIKNSNK
ncbi:MAG: restriction endonuclease subunit S [Melioribacteraceae bacterium]|nr:restriction endonuclease subunit S [Melioribacteraceae bacterium]